MTDEQELLAKFLEFANADYVPNTLFDRARALLASKPAEDDSVADGELIADLIEENRALRTRLAAAPTAPAQPCGEDAANGELLSQEQREALCEAIAWAHDDGLPGTADMLRSILNMRKLCDGGAIGLTDEQLLELRLIARTYNEQGFRKHAREFFARASLPAKKVAQAEPVTHDKSVVRAALVGLSTHVKACEVYRHLRGDMHRVDQAIEILAALPPATINKNSS